MSHLEDAVPHIWRVYFYRTIAKGGSGAYNSFLLPRILLNFHIVISQGNTTQVWSLLLGKCKKKVQGVPPFMLGKK